MGWNWDIMRNLGKALPAFIVTLPSNISNELLDSLPKMEDKDRFVLRLNGLSTGALNVMLLNRQFQEERAGSLGEC